MDPTRMTLIATGAGVLLAGVIVGPVVLMAAMNHDGDTASPLQEESIGIPAAHQLFAQGLQAEDAAYLQDRMEMTMVMTGTGDVLLGEAIVRNDPHNNEHEFYMMIDIASIEEAYGFDDTLESQESNGTAEADGFDEFGEFDDFGFGAFEDMERFEMRFVQVGALHAVSLGEGMSFAWRDHTPLEEDTFTLFAPQDADTNDPLEPPSPSTDELRRFIEAEEGVAVHSIEAADWEGTPSWKVTSTLFDEDAQGEGVFHFRQADMAPLAFDMTLTLLPEDGFASMVKEQDPDMDLSALEDFEIHMSMRFQYGTGFDIVFPEDVTRMSVNVATQDEQAADGISRMVTDEHDHRVPLSELKLHVVVIDEAATMQDPFGGPVVTEVLAELDLAEGLEGIDNGYEISYLDLDGDGMLSSGDWLEAYSDEDDPFWSNGAHRVALLIYDKWSGDYEGAPGPGIVLVLGVLAAAGLIARRKRTP